MKRLALTVVFLLTITPEAHISRAHDVNGAESLGIKVESLAKPIRQWDGTLLPHYPQGQPEIAILRIKYLQA
ncbi:hypothetical protein [Synechococcus sp. UW179A]|uniref:hypothetical protein n=1 Tax=Synechococcus sp. UW179A TaxID=2575510 RepID=UPI001FCAB880|nr:hypothetical protein [Synechococcus sp. UW179A]